MSTEKTSIKKEGKEGETHSEIGVTGLKRFGDHVHEEFLTELRSFHRRMKVLKEMSENDSVVVALLYAIEMTIRQVDWRIEAGGSTDEDLEAAEFLEECMNDMTMAWEDVVVEILSMISFGFTPLEIVYKRRMGPRQTDGRFRSKHTDGRIGWRKLPIRAQDTMDGWDWDDEGGLRGMWQQAPPTFNRVFIPIEKLLLFRTKIHKNNPEGVSVIRGAYRPWWFRKRIQNLEAIGVERDLAGFPVIEVPSEIMADDAEAGQQALYTQFKDIVSNVRRDEQEGIIMPSDADEKGNKLYDFKLVGSSGNRQFDTGKIIMRYSREILTTVLADFILLGQDKVGSFALSSSKTELFSKAITTYLGQIKSVMNMFAVPRLFALNDFKLEKLPTFEHGDIETVDLQEVGDFVSKLVLAGAEFFPDKELENFFRKQAGFPQRKDE